MLLVFVIGESTRGDRFSLNGYRRNTNPQLSQIQNLFSFKHAQSCDTLTIHSVHCLASPMLKSSPDRISPQFQVFKSYCTNPDVSKCSKTELDNAYDNTVLGVDNLLADVIRHLAQSGKKALLFYVSDHGESLGENGDYFHGKPVAVAPKEQFSVPFVVWFSDAYRQTPEGAALAQRVAEAANSDKAVSHDHIFHSVLGCAGMVSPNGGIDEQLNLCH